MILGIGTNRNFEPYWQSANLPSPTIVTADAKVGGSGWIYFDMMPERERERDG